MLLLSSYFSIMDFLVQEGAEENHMAHSWQMLWAVVFGGNSIR